MGNDMKINNIALILLANLFIVGCAHNNQFRHNFTAVCDYVGENSCPDSGITIETVESSQYRLGFIEFDDQGFLHNRNDKKKLIKYFQKIAAGNDEVLMISYVHGWHHNAKGQKEDSDIVDFRMLLREAAKAYPQKKVLGLYIGWRGRSLPWFLDYATFWGRKSTAHEIGQNGFAPTLLELEGIVKGTPEKKDKNTMITIGHSFGAAALYSSLKNVLIERYISSRPFESTNKVEGFGDLVLLMNPAFEALQYHSLYELSQNECRPYPDDQFPKLIILSALEDKAVRWAFPIGRSPNILLERHRNDASAKYCNPYPLEKEDRNEYQVVQWIGDAKGVGHHEAYVTHILKKSKNPHVSIFKSGDYKTNKDAWLDQLQSNQRDIYIGNNLVLHSKNRVRLFNPYMNIFTQDKIMRGHNDIWGSEIRSFVVDMIGVSLKNN